MDDLLDLDFTKSASTSKSPAAGNYGSSSGKSAFDYLAKSTASTSSYNSSSTRTTSPLGQPLQPQPKANGAGGGDAFSSLFGNTSTSTSNGVATGSTLSMAERIAKDRATSPSFVGGGGGGIASYNSNSRSSSPALQSIQQQPPIRNQSPSLSNSRFSTPPIRSNAPSPSPAPASVSTTGSKKVSDPWDFDLLSSTVPSSTSTSNNPNANANVNDPLFDLGFEQTLTSPPNPTLSRPSNTSPLPPTPTASSDEFVLLGAFSQPAKPSTATTNNLSNPSPSTTTTTTTTSPPNSIGVISPPPEMLLKLSTELGFSLQSSNRVLIEVFEKTGKFSLEDAVELLMSVNSDDSLQQLPSEEGGRGVTRNGKVRREIDEWGEEENVRIGRRRSWELEEGEDDIERRRRQQQRSTAEGSQAKIRRPQQETNEKTDHHHQREREREVSLEQLNAKVLQDQAQQALAQASKIGLNMFKSANAYWGAGKEALSKKLEEQRKAARIAAGLPPGTTGVGGGGATSTGGDSGRSDGRPKWWKEGMDLGEEEQAKSASTSRRNGKQREEETTKSEVSGFKDSDDEGVESVLPQRRPPQAQPEPRQKATTSSTDPSAEYRSPFRRAKATAPVPQPVEADLLSGNVSRPDEPTRRSTPPSSLPASRPSRPSPTPPSSSSAPSSGPSVSIPPSVLSTAISHKQTGNSQFKLGNYSSASESYSLALDLLPQDWIGRVLLLNNRAQSRLKNGGEEKLAILDCQESIRILTGSDGKGINVKSLERESQSLGKEVHELAGGGGGGGVDLRDQLGKSLGRRAKSFEMIEKWKDAMKDWETIRKFGDEVVVRGAGGSKLVGEGVERCRKMIDPPSSSSSVSLTQASRSSTSTTTRSTSTTSTTTVKKKRVEVEGSGEAVKALQASQALQLAEEDLRLQLKDQVDSRILSWKSNKETNLRALIASLDQVLWEELGWKKVGMNELITENQLKVRYVRAIAKVHPDKLNVGNTTVEQRMIAGAVFAALNEAWNATKA